MSDGLCNTPITIHANDPRWVQEKFHEPGAADGNRVSNQPIQRDRTDRSPGSTRSTRLQLVHGASRDIAGMEGQLHLNAGTKSKQEVGGGTGEDPSIAPWRSLAPLPEGSSNPKTQPNFTVGPWHRNTPPAVKYPTIFAGRNTHVAQVVTTGRGLTTENVECNCDLIVAAPDMYRALKRILADYKCYVLEDDAKESVRIGEAAIAKAEGRSL